VRDPLDYTEDELRSLSAGELKLLESEAASLESLYNTRQLVEKTLINSLYGALANKWFPLFNEEMAQAITGNGRCFIQMLANNIEKTLQGMLKAEKPYIVYGDTDSVTGDTTIQTSKGNIPIAELYDQTTGDIEVRGSENFINHPREHITATSVSKELTLENKRVTYIMKHKVKKRMFKIKCNGDEVVVTEDHSIMVLRDNVLTETKPGELRKGDKLIKTTAY